MSILFAAIVATTLIQQDGKPVAIFVYDRIKDVGVAQANVGIVLADNNVAAGMLFGRRWEGVDRPSTPLEADIAVVVYSASEKWTFLKHQDMAILADDVRIRPRIADRDRDIQFGSGTVTEQLTYRMTFADLVAIGKASSVEVAVGTKRWALSASQIDAVKQMSDLLKLNSRDAHAAIAAKAKRELEAAQDESRAAQAEAQAKAEAVMAKRQRLDPYRDSIDAAVEKSRKDVKKLPKRVQGTTGEKVKWRTFDREMNPIIEKNRLTPKDVSELLEAYPDFRVRYKIR